MIYLEYSRLLTIAHTHTHTRTATTHTYVPKVGNRHHIDPQVHQNATEHDYVDSIIMLIDHNAGPTLYVKDKIGRIPIQITNQARLE